MNNDSMPAGRFEVKRHTELESRWLPFFLRYWNLRRYRYAFSQRIGDIGLRIALGAQRGDTLRIVLSKARSCWSPAPLRCATIKSPGRCSSFSAVKGSSKLVAILSFSTGQGLRIPPGTAHRFRNKSSKPVRFLVISQPPSHGDRVDQ